MSNFVVAKSISIKAEPMVVWDALTNPKKTEKYFFNCKVFSTWKPGASITFKGKMFFFFPVEMHGKIEKAEPGRILKYTLKNGKASDTAASTSTITDVLTYQNGETIVSITDDVGDGDGAQKRFSRSQKGWDKILLGLKALIEHHKL